MIIEKSSDKISLEITENIHQSINGKVIHAPLSRSAFTGWKSDGKIYRALHRNGYDVNLE